jgi:hypothetical protein
VPTQHSWFARIGALAFLIAVMLLVVHIVRSLLGDNDDPPKPLPVWPPFSAYDGSESTAPEPAATNPKDAAPAPTDAPAGHPALDAASWKYSANVNAAGELATVSAAGAQLAVYTGPALNARSLSGLLTQAQTVGIPVIIGADSTIKALKSTTEVKALLERAKDQPMLAGVATNLALAVTKTDDPRNVATKALLQARISLLREAVGPNGKVFVAENGHMSQLNVTLRDPDTQQMMGALAEGADGIFVRYPGASRQALHGVAVTAIAAFQSHPKFAVVFDLQGTTASATQQGKAYAAAGAVHFRVITGPKNPIAATAKVISAVS